MKKTSRNLIVRSLEDLKAIDTQILDLTGINSFTAHLIITTGTSSPHISAISKKLYGELKKIKSQFMVSKGRVLKNGFF